MDAHRLGDDRPAPSCAGSSDAYGSWKTIWIFARSVAQLAAAAASSTSSPSKRTEPDVGSSSRSTQPAGRGLPAARLPDEPERLAPVAPRSDTPDTALHRRRPSRRKKPARIGNVLDEVVDLEHRRRAAGVGRASPRFRSTVMPAHRDLVERRPRSGTPTRGPPPTAYSSGRSVDAHARARRRTGSAGGTRSPAAGRSATAAGP